MTQVILSCIGMGAKHVVCGRGMAVLGVGKSRKFQNLGEKGIDKHGFMWYIGSCAQR